MGSTYSLSLFLGFIMGQRKTFMVIHAQSHERLIVLER
jgi:hypothetical protein